MRIVIITGLSGSGKSTAVRALEDEGFFCIDNLPVTLFPTFLELVRNSRQDISDVALVMDIRGKDFLKGYEKVFQEIEELGHSIEIVFFDTSDEVLLRRFSETRRRHPAMVEGSLAEAIHFEREQLAGLRRMATLLIDTSEFNVHQLKQYFVSRLKGDIGARPLQVHVQSFGYRYGIPMDSDLVLDVRFLPNPYFLPDLKEQTGLDPQVRAHVLGSSESVEFLCKLTDILGFLLPCYTREGKSYLTISIGCTGGRHRSVAIAEELRVFLSGKQVQPRVTHRDKDKR